MQSSRAQSAKKSPTAPVDGNTIGNEVGFAPNGTEALSLSNNFHPTLSPEELKQAEIVRTKVVNGWLMAITPENMASAVREFIPAARSGNYVAASHLVLLLAHAVKQGVALSPELATYFSNALASIADGANPVDSLNLKRKRGQKNTEKALWRNAALAFAVGELHYDQGMTIDDAVAHVAAEMMKDKLGKLPLEDTVRFAWRTHKNNIRFEQTRDGKKRVNGMLIAPPITKEIVPKR